MKHTSMHGFLFSLTMGLFLIMASSAVTAADSPHYPLTKITNDIYVIYGPFDLPSPENRGFRNNVVIVLTSAGVVVLDPGGSAAAGEMVVRGVKTLTNSPIVAVFDSHAHGDHWLGNEGIKRTYPNAVIYGHSQMIKRVAGDDGIQWLETINRLTNGRADGKRVVNADKAVNDGDTIRIGSTTFRIHHTGPGHTDNDIMVEIVEARVLFIGDIVRNGMLGIMEDDASFKGNITAIDAMLRKDFKLFIPGHGKAGGPEVILNYRVYLNTLRSTVKALYDEGMAEFEMKPKVMQAVTAYKDWDGFEMRIGQHINRAYLEIEKEAF